jgi:uncharacterized protein
MLAPYSKPLVEAIDMRTLTIASIAASVFFANHAIAAKPSFDCAKASHEIEELICVNEELAELDVSLNNLYKTVLKNTPAQAQKRLKAEQIGWVKGRNDCWKADDKVACTRSAYQERIS